MFFLLVFICFGFSHYVYAAKVSQREEFKKGTITIQNQKEQIFQIHKAMLARKKKIELYYAGKKEDLETDLEKCIDKVLAMDQADSTTDGDYLRNIRKQDSQTITTWNKQTKLSYEFTYIETKKQTEMVDKTVKQVLKKLISKEDTAPQKIKKIHDYIINEVTYDTSATYRSAYDALIRKKSVCQGYALLLYKMSLEAGIPCRIITGKGDGVDHAWNIVKIGNKWYNIDCTWDDPITVSGENMLRYDYFLKNEADFLNHIRENKYQTEQFQQEHPMAKKSYGKIK